jgi:hypothetical protein
MPICVERRQNVLNLLGSDLFQGHDRIEQLVGDVAALRGLIDQLRDGGVGEIEKRQQGIRDLGTLLQRFFPSAVLPWSCLPSVSPRPALSRRRVMISRVCRLRRASRPMVGFLSLVHLA